MKKAILSIAAVTVIGGTSAYALSGNDAGVNTAELNNAADTAQSESETGAADAEETEEQISEEEAVAIAKTVVDGTLDEVELDTEDGLLIYEVELDYQGEDYDIDVDAHTGEIVKVDDDLLGTSAEEEMNVSLQEAEEIALSAFSSGKIDDRELETKNGRFVYELEVEIHDEDGDVYVDAQTGKILHIESDLMPYTKEAGSSTENSLNEADSSPENQEGNKEQITPAEAKEIALAHIGNGYVDDIELERENGSLMYEVEIEGNGDDVDVYVDAYSGEVVHVDH
ncbi:PepSY domain-containing protein [Alkalicoccus daliensis]|uniref:Uncharacterized membrane protein YkoI n=1 Tax=Alkalicoccus daliensis TaxID=745820 RepID=A0A1H0IST8_9BACI|nr:PepSY domain-containing protein [Alkalicoccus daliensis]SDO34487.1 Uncharacterized membrane protein YkoI [Alkalicoccus daliensis]